MILKFRNRLPSKNKMKKLKLNFHHLEETKLQKKKPQDTSVKNVEQYQNEHKIIPLALNVSNLNGLEMISNTQGIIV